MEKSLKNAILEAHQWRYLADQKNKFLDESVKKACWDLDGFNPRYTVQ
jgi:hypothetical protein